MVTLQDIRKTYGERTKKMSKIKTSIYSQIAKVDLGPFARKLFIFLAYNIPTSRDYTAPHY